MKINDLKKLIRQVVKEEVASEVSKAMGKVLVEMVREIKNPTINSDKETITESEEPQISATVIKTNNPKLNSVLAETARNFKPLKKSSVGSLANLLDGDFDKIGQGESAGVSEPKTKIDFLKTIITENTTSQPSALDGGSEVPDMLKKVFKKDFRAVMKAIDEKKKSGTMGIL